MNFEAVQKETVILNPQKDMARKVIPSEIRKDPLTGRTSRICHVMKLQWQKPDFDKLIAKTADTCPFCPEKIMKITPCFPSELIPEGRLISDDMVLFPNVAPYDSLSAVATMGSRHYIPISEIEPDRIAKAFRLALEFFRRIYKIGHSEAVYPIINWNYMPPSGSSLIHPHLQVFFTSSAPNLMRHELEAAKLYMDKEKKNFWDELVSIEAEKGERYLGKIGRFNWLSSYAPLGVAGDVLAVADGVFCTLDLTDNDLSDIALGLTKAMKVCDRMGIYSFNMNFFTGTQSDDFTRFHLVFSPRTFFNQVLSAPDVGALQKLFNESICMAFPEDINKMFKLEF
jgi:UDPglucose--hexose-1-phosphate uridylyltransferase